VAERRPLRGKLQFQYLFDRLLPELERSLRIDNVKKAMRLSRLEGVLIGRRPLPVDRAAIVRDRLSGDEPGCCG